MPLPSSGHAGQPTAPDLRHPSWCPWPQDPVGRRASERTDGHRITYSPAHIPSPYQDILLFINFARATEASQLSCHQAKLPAKNRTATAHPSGHTSQRHKELPVAVMTKSHELDDLKQHTFTLSPFSGGQKSETKVLAGWCFLEAVRGEMLVLLPATLVSQAGDLIIPVSAAPPSPTLWPLPCLYANFPLLRRTTVIALGPPRSFVTSS